MRLVIRLLILGLLVFWPSRIISRRKPRLWFVGPAAAVMGGTAAYQVYGWTVARPSSGGEPAVAYIVGRLYLAALAAAVAPWLAHFVLLAWGNDRSSARRERQDT